MSTLFLSHRSADNELARELARQLAQHGHRSIFLDIDPEQGIVAGRNWEQTLYRKLRACRAVLALCTDHYLESKWCFAEVALARMEGKRIITVKADPLDESAELPSILTDRQFVDLRRETPEGYRNDNPEAYRRLLRGLADLERFGSRGDWDPTDPPYLGLNTYQEEHAPIFFGRDDETREGLELLERGAPGLVLVLGASGSGKSSLVRAGILPQIREQSQWLIVDPFRPGREPFLELSESLVQSWRRYVPESPSAADLRQRIRRDLESWDSETETTPLGQLARELQRAAAERESRVLLIVDQFEELLGNEDADGRASRLLALLRATLEADRSPVMILATMRSDYLESFQRNDALQGIDFASLSLGPMQVEGMRQVIEEPARLGQLELETGLANRLLEDTETPDALPLLSFTLWILWRDYRDDGKLEIAEYEALGGLDGAVAREADALLDSATRQGEREALRHAFLRMARLTEERSFTRRQIIWNTPELLPVHDHLERFVGRRLLTSRAEHGERVIEVTHEALFRSWKPLRAWLENSRAELLLRQQIRRDAAAWDEQDRALEHLWRGGRLQQAIELRRKETLDPLEDAFVRVSQRSQQVRRTALIGGTLAVILILAGLLYFALAAADRAEKARAESQNLARAAIAANLLESDPLRANLLLLEVEDAETLPSAMAALHRAPTVPMRWALSRDTEALFIAYSFNRDGTLLAVVFGDRTTSSEIRLAIWDLVSGRRLDKVFGPWEDFRLAFSPTRDHLFLVDEEGTISLWDARSGQPVSSFGPPPALADPALVRFSKDGNHILLLSSDGDAALLDALSGRVVSTVLGLPVDELPEDEFLQAHAVPLHFDDQSLLVKISETEIGLWDIQSGHPKKTFRTDGEILELSLRPDGARVLAHDEDRGLRLLDLDSNLVERGAHDIDEGPVELARLSVDGTRAAIVSDDGVLGILDFRALPTTSRIELENSHEFELEGEGAIDEPTIFFTADGRRVLNFSTFHGLTGLWDVETGELIMAIPGLPTAVSPDGSQIATYRKTPGEKSKESYPLYVWRAPSSTELTETEASDCVWCEAALANRAEPDDTEDGIKSPDGKLIAYEEEIEQFSVVQILDAVSDEVLWTRRGAKPRFSDDSRYVMTLGSVTATIWETQSGREVAFLEDHDTAVEDAIFSPDARWALTASEGGTVHLWHVESGNPLTRYSIFDGAHLVNQRKVPPPLPPPPGMEHTADTSSQMADSEDDRPSLPPLPKAAFSPDSSRLVVDSGDDRRIWAIAPDLLQGLIRARTNLCLEPEFRLQRLGETREEAWNKFERCEACQGRCVLPDQRAGWLGESLEVAEDRYRVCRDRLAAESPESSPRASFEASWRMYQSCINEG